MWSNVFLPQSGLIFLHTFSTAEISLSEISLHHLLENSHCFHPVLKVLSPDLISNAVFVDSLLVEQGLVNYSPGAKSNLTSDFVSTVLLECRHASSFRVLCERRHATVAEASSCNRDHMAHKPEVFTVLSFTEKVC